MKLVIELPTRETPGYLRRQKRALEFSEKLKENQNNASIIDEMIEFILPLVKTPEDRTEAREALWDISESKFEEILMALTGTKKQTDPTKAENLIPSNDSTSQG